MPFSSSERIIILPKRLYILYPFTALLLGMLLTQVLATVHVYLSNTALYSSLSAIKDAGYLAVPNQYVMPELKSFSTAFYGALFFTFSIGAGLSFLSMALAWVWDRLFFRKKYLLYVFFSLWLLCLIALNIYGFKFFVTLYFLTLPPIVFAITANCLTNLNKQNRHRNEMIHVIPVIVLALFLFWQTDARMFTDFRDIFLIANPVGSKINNFYYKYTLYPAEAFKSLNQKMLKTCRIEKIKEASTRQTLENILISHDYIPLTGNNDVDLEVILMDSEIEFKNRSQSILRMTADDFFANPDKAIKQFAQKSDGHSFFRKFTFFSLLMGFPIAVYVIWHAFIAIVFSFFLRIKIASAIASGICFVICLILFFSFHLNRGPDVSINNLTNALSSDRWQKRVAALKLIDEKGLEIRNYQAYPKLLASTNNSERYWFIKTLGNSRSSATYRDLLGFLDDPDRNVLTMTFYALGQRGNRHAISKIINKIETSNDWYNQWYAYRALRSLGWKQTKLK